MRVYGIYKISSWLSCLLAFIFILAASCQPRQQTLPAQQETSPALLPSATQLPDGDSFPTLTHTFPPPTSLPTYTPIPPTPAIYYQLTYISACGGGTHNCMYALDVGCWESEYPCFSEPRLLFEIPKEGQGPRYPMVAYDWSPDGRKIVIDAAGEGGGQGDIFLGDWAGQNWNNLTHSPVPESSPVWFPEGRWIIYYGKSGKPGDDYVRVFRMDESGSQVVELLTNSRLSSKYSPSWSLDGKHLVFEGDDKDGHFQVFIANPDGSELHQLTNQPGNHFDPRLSPDGEWIVFSAEAEESPDATDIYLIHPDGTGEKAVTQDKKGYKFGSIWSPTGDWIAFFSNTEGNWDIYLVRPDGTGLMRITADKKDETSPGWRKMLP